MQGDSIQQVADIVRRKAPDIEVFVIPSTEIGLPVRKAAASRPTLVFSIGPLVNFRPKRGKIYCGQVIPKTEQMQRLQRAGIPVPRWTEIKKGIKLDPEEWGPQVVVKPAGSEAWGGHGVQYVKTKGVRYIPKSRFPANHIGRREVLIAQKLVYTGMCPCEYRVLCLFGQPLYAIRRNSKLPHPSPADQYILNDKRDFIGFSGLKKFGFSDDVRTAILIEDADILSLARQAFSAHSNAPLQGVDIVKEAGSGELYVLEINPRGFTWHFESGVGLKHSTIQGIRREDQMDGFSVAADVLIERTRAEAK